MNTASRRPLPKLLVIDDSDRYIELAHVFLRDYAYATRCDLPGPCWDCPQRPGCQRTHAHDASEASEALMQHPDVDVVLLDMDFQLPAQRLLPLPGVLKRRRGSRAAIATPTSTTASASASPPTSIDGFRVDAAADATQQRWQGLAILSQLRRQRADLPVILLTSQEELASELHPDALSSDEFLTVAGGDALDARALGLLIERVLLLRRQTVSAGGYWFGRSAAMAQLRREASVLAKTALPMLIVGETGTGKSALCEQVIHPESGRRGPFVSVDLSAIPESLLAAELFGTARGAYSGATDRAGRFEAAHLGTLFLDEIGNLPLDVQRMLLLVLQEGRVTRLGENTARPVQVKVVAATHVDLAQAVRAGRFRADLYARLNPAARLQLPPLRERRADLEPLLTGLLRKTFASGPNRQLLVEYADAARLPGAPQVDLHIDLGIGRKPSVKGAPPGVRFVLSSVAMADIQQHPFPGNVRELELLIANAALLSLADALHAAREARAVPASAHTIPISNQQVRRLLAGSWPVVDDAASGAARPSSVGTGMGTGTASASGAALEPERSSTDGEGEASGAAMRRVTLRAGASLHAVAQDVERQIYAQLYAEEGSFEAMARRLLRDDSPGNARRVRLRFNQLGLRVRSGA